GRRRIALLGAGYEKHIGLLILRPGAKHLCEPLDLPLRIAVRLIALRLHQPRHRKVCSSMPYLRKYIVLRINDARSMPGQKVEQDGVVTTRMPHLQHVPKTHAILLLRQERQEVVEIFALEL